MRERTWEGTGENFAAVEPLAVAGIVGRRVSRS